MKIVLLAIGKTKEQYLIEGISQYQKRLNHYTQFELLEIPNIKNANNLSDFELLRKEGELIFQQLQAWLHSGKKRLVFVVGGAYGFSEQVYQRGNEKLSLSKMTFSHQMVRLFFVEQMYRGYTILNNEPYHHE
jgi:23S rRNA (pseudouridine1915-N3)-methyltransferase